MDRTKEITLPKPKPEMGADGITHSHVLVDAKIFKYQTYKYVNQLTNTKNRVKTTDYLGCGQCSKVTRSKIKSLPIFYQARYDYRIITTIKLI